MRHTISKEDFDQMLRTPNWVPLARSAGRGSSKSLDIDATSAPVVFKVLDHGEEVFIGTDSEAALAAYNEAR